MPSRHVPVLFGVLLAGLLFSHRALTAQMPDLLDLRFDEGAGAITANAAFPGVGSQGQVTGGAALSSVTSRFGAGSLVTGLSPADGVLFTNPVLPPTIAFTIEFWIERPTFSSNVAYAFGNWCNATSGLPTSIEVQMQGTGPMVVLWLNGVQYTFSHAMPPAVGNWVHCGFVVDGPNGVFNFYVNGVLALTQTIAAPATLAALFQSGIIVGGAELSNCFPNATSVPTHLDEFRLWSRARSTTEIQVAWNVDLHRFYATEFRTASPAPIVFDPVTHTLSLTAAISSSVLGSASPIALPHAGLPNGLTLTVTAPYTGSDLQGLTDITLSPATVHLVAVAGQDEIVITNGQTAIGAPRASAFRGATALVVERRAFQAQSAPIVQRIGAGSAALDHLAGLLQTSSAWSIVTEAGVTAPSVSRVALDFTLPAAVAESRLTTDGNGNLLLGDLGLSPNAPVFHLFDLQPAIALGAGPVFGLALTPTVLAEIGFPLGTTPIHVTTDAHGDYLCLLPPGAVPPGTVVDTVTLGLSPTGAAVTYSSPVRRVTF